MKSINETAWRAESHEGHESQNEHTESGHVFEPSVPSVPSIQIETVAVAALIKFYLTESKRADMDTASAAMAIMRQIVEPGIDTGRVTINCEKLAQVIDAARDYVKSVTLNGSLNAIHASGDPLLERTLNYINEDLLQNLSGTDYVRRMPIELADMLLECYE